jgi:hypothetical protein
VILTAADTYGADVRTGMELKDLPEATYHEIDEVVAAVKNSVARVVARSQLPATRCCDWRA